MKHQMQESGGCDVIRPFMEFSFVSIHMKLL
jgi:hypothetical protein